MKRFYRTAAAAPADGGYAVLLDGKALRTPARREVSAPTLALAEAVAAEWMAQGDTVRPQTMPLTQLLMTAIDRVADERPAMAAAVLAHLDTDLLCYRAGPPAAVAARQSALWEPWLAWFAERYGARLLTTEMLDALRQPAAAHAAAEKRVDALDDLAFAALQLVVGMTGSLVLGLAMLDDAITPLAVEAALYAEEDLKAEFYREDVHGRAPQEELRRAGNRRDLEAAQMFLRLLRAGQGIFDLD